MICTFVELSVQSVLVLNKETALARPLKAHITLSPHKSLYFPFPIPAPTVVPGAPL